jgi:hypothetical protein
MLLLHEDLKHLAAAQGFTELGTRMPVAKSERSPRKARIKCKEGRLHNRAYFGFAG